MIFFKCQSCPLMQTVRVIETSGFFLCLKLKPKKQYVFQRPPLEVGVMISEIIIIFFS